MKPNIRKHLFRSLVLALLVIALGSCVVVLTPPSYISISNTSSIYTLAHVYITAHTSTSWGSDQLYPDVITPGQSATFQVAPGAYDVLVRDTSVPPYDAIASNVQVASSVTVALYYDGIHLAP